MSRLIVLGIGGFIGLLAWAFVVLSPEPEEPWEETRLLCTFQSHCVEGDCSGALPGEFRLVPRDATGRAQIGMEGHPTYLTRYRGEDHTRFETEAYADTLPLASIRLYADLAFAYDRPEDATLGTGECAAPTVSLSKSP